MQTRSRPTLRVYLAGATALTSLWATAARAQQSAPSQSEALPGATSVIEDVVVTAERRSSSVQNTPLAISAISGESLTDRKIADVQDLAQTLPSVNINPTLGNGRIAVRGIGLDTTQAGGEGRVAFHVDGVYYSRPSSTLAPLFDISRVEVVRGPQGTLYGRNATAGAINVITKDPDDFLTGDLHVTAGNYGLVQSQGAVSIPLNDFTGLRLSGQITDRDGYGENLNTGEDINDARTRSARAVLLSRPTDDLQIRLAADYHREDDANYAFYYMGAGNPLIVPTGERLGGLLPEGRDTYADIQQVNDREFWGVSGTVDWNLGWADLTSITAYRHSDTRFSADADGTSVTIGGSNQFETSGQVSQEFRLSGDFARGSWLVGAYYFDERLDGFNTFSPLSRAIVGGPLATLVQGFKAGGRIDTVAWAVFGEARYSVLDDVTLVLGGRYSNEEKRAQEFTVTDLTTPYDPATEPVPIRFTDQTKSWDAFTPRVSVEYRPMERVMLYATYAEGFKSGGFAPGLLLAPVDPETLTDYEIGLKADWFDQRLRTNIAVYSYRYENLQVSKIVSGGAQLVNAAEAELRGAEFEITAVPMAPLQIDLSVSLIDSEYTDFQTADPARPTLGVIDLAGNQLAQAPDYTVNLGAQYVIENDLGRFTMRGEGSWSGRVYFNAFNRDELSQAPTARFNAFLNYEAPGDRWTASLYVRNLTDEDIVSFAYTSNPLFGTPIIGNYYPPRTFGLDVGYRF